MKRIALVEDNADNRVLFRALLEEHYEVEDYEDGVEALAGLAASVPDLVLLDISLPGLDGLGVLQRIRADDRLKALPVIALTAHAMAGDRERFLDAGFNAYVTKPIVDETQLLNAVQRLLAR